MIETFLTTGLPPVAPAPGRPVAGMASAAAFAEFLSLAQGEAVPDPTGVDERTFWRWIFSSDETLSQRRLEALRRRDPVLAARLAAILKLPLWLQQVTLADIQLSRAKRDAEQHPERPERAAYRQQLRAVASAARLSSVFDAGDALRWL